MTIDERAFKKYPKHSDSEMETEMVSPRRNAYIANCKEQKAIDFEESSDFWNRVIVRLGVDNYHCHLYLMDYKKAMEE